MFALERAALSKKGKREQNGQNCLPFGLFVLAFVFFA
jgi:hypothetical protein